MPRYGRTRTAVYGIRTEEKALAAADAGFDALGFIFNPRSTRFIEPEEAWEIAALLPPLVSTIGVFENASVDKFSEIEERCPTDYTQLHGDEPEDVVRQCGTRAIKTVRFDPATLSAQLKRWDAIDEIDAVLVALGPGAAERRESLDAIAAASGAMVKPLMVGGGVTPATAGAVIEGIRPWGIAVSSAVENAAGDKSPELLAAFIAAVRDADARLALTR